MKDNNKIRIQLLILMIVLLSMFSIFTYYYEKNNIKLEINKTNKQLRDNVNSIFNVLLEDLEKTTTARVNNILNTNGIIDNFANKNRSELYRNIKQKFSNFKNFNPHLKIMTFRLVDGTTFLRVHKPKMYGDKLNKKRKIIVDTNLLKIKQFGFEVGKLYMTYRVVVPIFYKKEYIGLVETGIDVNIIINKLNKIYNLKNALLVKKDMTSVNINNKNFKLITNEFSLVQGDQLFYNHKNKIKFDIGHNHIVDNNIEYHINSSLNLYNHKKEVAGKVLLAYDTTEYLKDFDMVLIKNIVKIILIMLIFIIVLNIAFNFFIDKIKIITDKNIQIKEQLFKSEKMAAMGEMIGNISHQWRQPLSVISTGSTGMKMQKEFGTLSDDDFYKQCDMINNNAQYLSKTIDDFKNFIKGDRNKEIFSLKDDISSFLNLVEGAIKNNHINMVLDIQEGIKINGYENELIQCLINIFNNAKDVLIEKEIKDKFIFISTSIDENKAVIKIKDNGNGIPKDIINKVFEPYFTTKHQSRGTGLGLHMTYSLISDGMNGTIDVANKVYKYEEKEYTGAEFTISLAIS